MILLSIARTRGLFLEAGAGSALGEHRLDFGERNAAHFENDDKW